MIPAPRAPAGAIVTAEFQNQVYYIPSTDQRSLETLAVLAEIIGFQTTDATLNESKPTVTVNAN